MLQVLSHRLSPQATAMCNNAQQGENCGVLVLGFLGTSDDARDLRNLVKKSTAAYLLRWVLCIVILSYVWAGCLLRCLPWGFHYFQQ